MTEEIELNDIADAPDQEDVLLYYNTGFLSGGRRWIVAGWFEDAFYAYEADSTPVPNPIGWLPLPPIPT